MSVKSRIKKRTHKFGIELPGPVHEAYEINNKNENHFWRDAIIKEMKNNRVA